MNIVGIDPSPEDYAVVILTPAGNIARAARVKTTEDLVFFIEEQARVYIEGMTSYGQPVGKEVFETCYQIGRALEKFPEAKIVSRLAVKKFFGVERKSKNKKVPIADAQIKRAMEDIFPKEHLKAHKITKDLWQALAVAVYARGAQNDFDGDEDQQEES